MRKKLLPLLGVACFALMLGVTGCDNKQDTNQQVESSNQIAATYTVAFEVEGTRYKTLKVKDGEKITETITNPTKEGHTFVGWYEDTTLVDLSTYVVTHNVTFTAKFEAKHDEGPVLDVDCVKEEGKEYYLVLGWWEVNDPEDPDKRTSYLTRDLVRMFYGNLIKYLTATGATEENIAAISFRNYSSAKVDEMGNLVKADGDVDLLVGVGNNVNSTAGLSLYNGSNDYKFQTQMSTDKDGKPVSRYVALLDTASELGLSTYEWLDTPIGHKSFLQELTDEEIQSSISETINITVTIHGDTDVTTVLTSKEGVLDLPTITVPNGYHFLGFALSADGEVVLTKAIGEEIGYNDIKNLVASNTATLDLYPIFEQDQVAEANLVVYVQTNNITDDEVALLEERFNATLHNNEVVSITAINADAAGFTEALDATVDVVVGGNNPLKNYKSHESGPLANAGTGHFENTSRKVLIRNTVSEGHLALAQAFYNFVVADYPAE